MPSAESSQNSKIAKINKYDIVKALQSGKTAKEICSEFGVAKSTIYGLKERGNLLRKPGSGRKISVTTPAFESKLRTRFEQTPNKSFRAMARELKVNEKAVRNVAKKYGLKSRAKPQAKTQANIVKEHLKASRLERAKKILWMLKKKKPTILFISEKYFMVDTVAPLNLNNKRDVPEHDSKCPSQIMVFGLVASDGRKMPPVFLPYGLKMVAKDYITLVLKDHVLPWVQANFGDSDEYIFRNPAHTSSITQKWLTDHLKFWPKNIWPPKSADLNPLNFSIWAEVECWLVRGLLPISMP